MQGIWLDSGKAALRDDLPGQAPPAGEALIRPRLCGVCGTDIELMRGLYGFCGVAGHEFVGEVIEAPGAEDWVGARVVGEINAGCGRCAACGAGRSRHCEVRTVLGILGRPGVFAERFCLPLSNLHRVPEALADERAVFVEPLAAALRIQQQLHLRPRDRVLLLGAGRLGQLIARTLALTGCALQVVARRPRPRELLRRLGIEALEQAPTERFDVVVDATGARDGFALARRCVRAGGTIVLKTTCVGETPVDLSLLVVDEITVVGSRCGPFDAALRLLASGAVKVDDLVEDRFPLASGPQALGRAAEPGRLKVLIEP